MRKFARGLDRHVAPAARPHHPDPPLQHRLRLLQRVRQGLASRSRRARCSRASIIWPRSARRWSSFSGGEPLLHPDLDELIARIRSHGMMAGLITNGFLLSPKRIEALNRAGLDYLQISIDNVVPDEVSKKSLQTARQPARVAARPRALRRQHQLGAGRRHQDAGRRAHHHRPRARASGFSTSIGIIHDGSGRLKPLAPRERVVYDEVSRRVSKPVAGVEEPVLGYPVVRRQPGRRQAERMALPRRRPLPLRLRERPGPLLLAAARLSGRSARSATRSATSSASSWRRSRARRTARSAACTAPRPWTTGATRRSPSPARPTRTRPKVYTVVRSS